MSASAPETSVHSVKFNRVSSCTSAIDINCSVFAFVSYSPSKDAAGEKTQDFLSHPEKTCVPCISFHLTGKI